ncbi:DNA-binding protein [Phytoactinopolyspora endophytica]|uniref:DNA-binding protein n=1 Tax=Phytoactinopolyspora endophytica TaxID=1642495 RepID=UPI00101CE976|nr:DNA-binding protein [Phytoactinopolyspora endophytica]
MPKITLRPRHILTLLTIGAFALVGCSDDGEDFNSILGGGSASEQGGAGDQQQPGDLPEDISGLSQEELVELAEQGLEGLTEEQRAEIDKMLEEAELSDPSAGAEHGDESTDRQDQPGSDQGDGDDGSAHLEGAPERMCDLISPAEMSTALGVAVTTDVQPEAPESECLFDVDGVPVASVQAYYAPLSKGINEFFDEQTVHLWGRYSSEQLLGWGGIARYGSISGGEHSAIGLARPTGRNSFVAMIIWMEGDADRAMLEKGARIAEIVVPQL